MNLRKNGRRAEPQPPRKVARRVIEGRLVAAEDAERARKVELDQLEAERGEMERRLAAFAGREAGARLGEEDGEAVRREREEVEVCLREVASRIAENRRAEPGLQRVIAEARAALRKEQTDQAKEDWLLTLASRLDACAELRRHLSSAQEAVSVLGAARAEEAAMRNAYERAAVAAGAAIPELVSAADEPDWSAGLQQLRAVLTEAPHRPVASERARNEKAAAEREIQHRELVRWHVKEVMRAGNAAMRRVPERLRDDVEREAAEERARRERRARELVEQAEAERAARSGEPRAFPDELEPGQPFVRLG